MAAEDDQHMLIHQDGIESSSSSESENDSSGEDATTSVEWLANGRKKRSTAGNRMKSMLAAEEPDDELELLFAENSEDDAGFTDIDGDGSDMQMDSSSDEEEGRDEGDELAGEKELEKQARESRQAARKRKAQEAIPAKFRKKVKIDATAASGDSVAADGAAPAADSAPKPRPKKKSERVSWLPSSADMPTRSSKRETTMLSKEQLHQQMIEREVKRLKQVEAMERKAKKMEALKKPPMTQAQRLAEAVFVEKKNSKSLNRWEEAEKQREEERRAKLAALNNRKLDGAVVTFWSGAGEWINGKLKHVGKLVTIEEKPARKKRTSAVRHEEPTEASSNQNGSQEEVPKPRASDSKNGPSALNSTGTDKVELEFRPPDRLATDAAGGVRSAASVATPEIVSTAGLDQHRPETKQPSPEMKPRNYPADLHRITDAGDTHEQSRTQSGQQEQKKEPKEPDTGHFEAKTFEVKPPEPPQYTTSMFAPPPPQAQVMQPPDLKPPSNSFLAPPAGARQSPLSMPVLGYSSASTQSNVLAPPNTTQRQSPLSMPLPDSRPPPAPAPPRPAQAPLAPPHPPAAGPVSQPKPTQTNNPKQAAVLPVSSPPAPPVSGKATRNCIVLQNFDENAIKEKSVQTRILFGREMGKLPKQAPPPRCVITNRVARYRDPRTGLPYSDVYAYGEIQKLRRGDYKWSYLVDVWVGPGDRAATGVPARFLDPNAPAPAADNDGKEGKEEGEKTKTAQAQEGGATEGSRQDLFVSAWIRVGVDAGSIVAASDIIVGADN